MHPEGEAPRHVEPGLELDLVAVTPFPLARDACGNMRLDPPGVHAGDSLESVDDRLALPA